MSAGIVYYYLGGKEAGSEMMNVLNKKKKKEKETIQTERGRKLCALPIRGGGGTSGGDRGQNPLLETSSNLPSDSFLCTTESFVVFLEFCRNFKIILVR
jgi:hypothetical protein